MKAGFLDLSYIFLTIPKAKNTLEISYSLLIFVLILFLDGFDLQKILAALSKVRSLAEFAKNSFTNSTESDVNIFFLLPG